MTEALEAALAALDRKEPAILVEVLEVLGSTPREAQSSTIAYSTMKMAGSCRTISVSRASTLSSSGEPKSSSRRSKPARSHSSKS